jgi:hypothetical protein
MDDDTTLPWSALCAEVSKAKISLREGRLVELPVAVGDRLSAVPSTVAEPMVMSEEKLAERTGLEDAADATPQHPARRARALRVVDGAPNVTEHHGVPAMPVTADPVVAELEGALALRRSGADAKALRRALRRIEELLDE